MSDYRAAMIQGLRDLATYLEVNPSLPYPGLVDALICLQTGDEFRAVARRMGTVAKEFEGNYVSLVKRFGPVKYEVFVKREEVCIRKVVGTRTVPEKVEEIVEWSCDDVSLLAPKHESAVAE